MKSKKLFAIFLMFFIYSKHIFAECSLDFMISEISSIHGANWINISEHCTAVEAKKHLRNIYENPQKALSQHDLESQFFMARGAIKGFGHFAKPDDEGKISKADEQFLIGVYQDKSGLMKNYYKESNEFFRINAMESFANTGSINSLNFFYKILKNENPLYIKKYAAEYSGWVFNGTPFDSSKPQMGSRIYETVFYPNIQNKIEERYENNNFVLSRVEEIKEKYQKILKQMLKDKKKYSKIDDSLNSLLVSINNDDVTGGMNGTSSVKKVVESSKPEVEKIDRKIASEDKKNNEIVRIYPHNEINWVMIIVSILLVIVFSFYVLKKK